MSRSVFLRPMHPKTEVSPTRASVEKVLRAGWVGQIKIHGHRAQIHISADPTEETLAFNRQGKLHKKLLPEKIIKELRRVLDLETGWTVIDAEWLKDDDKLFIFDVMKLNSKSLNRMTYLERWKLLPREYISPHLQTLPLLQTVEKCMDVLGRPEEYIEGLVFKSVTSAGFKDTAVIRCRKRKPV